MRLYRILTEHKNRAAIVARVSRDFHGFTVLEAAGMWRGVAERTLVIEIVAETADYAAVRAVADTIKWANQQEAVLLQVIELTGSELI